LKKRWCMDNQISDLNIQKHTYLLGLRRNLVSVRLTGRPSLYQVRTGTGFPARRRHRSLSLSFTCSWTSFAATTDGACPSGRIMEEKTKRDKSSVKNTRNEINASHKRERNRIFSFLFSYKSLSSSPFYLYSRCKREAIKSQKANRRQPRNIVIWHWYCWSNGCFCLARYSKLT